MWPHIWTHVTSPFFSSINYDQAIDQYFSQISSNRFDSLMSVTKLQSFLWTNEGPFNYSILPHKWPSTQSLKEIYEVNSAVFVSSVENYRMFSDRIGQRPFFFNTSKLASFDIDWPDDFEPAEALLNTSSEF